MVSAGYFSEVRCRDLLPQIEANLRGHLQVEHAGNVSSASCGTTRYAWPASTNRSTARAPEVDSRVVSLRYVVCIVGLHRGEYALLMNTGLFDVRQFGWIGVSTSKPEKCTVSEEGGLQSQMSIHDKTRSLEDLPREQTDRLLHQGRMWMLILHLLPFPCTPSAHHLGRRAWRAHEVLTLRGSKRECPCRMHHLSQPAPGVFPSRRSVPGTGCLLLVKRPLVKDVL